jgi:crotonobetainyl-CoA:carnitine CoA-transferase CaiB-like acyl-CoA transferase
VRGVSLGHRGVVQHTSGVYVIFELLNRGKKSLAVDLNSLQGQEIVRKLATQVDILVTNLTRHRQDRYRLNYEDVSKANARIIYVALTGYGPEGPDRDRSGFDYAAFWARSGIMGSLGEAGSLPIQQRPGMGDQVTSLAMTAAIALGLYEREQSGVGQRIDCSLLNTGLWAIGGDVMAALQSGRAPDHICRSEVGNPLFNYYQCADGKWVQLVMIESERFWDGFCRAVGLHQIVADPRFERHALRSQNNRELIRILVDLFLTKPRAEWWIAKIALSLFIYRRQ